jgi:hypothetical protein
MGGLRATRNQLDVWQLQMKSVVARHFSQFFEACHYEKSTPEQQLAHVHSYALEMG